VPPAIPPAANPPRITWARWLEDNRFGELFGLQQGNQPHFGTLPWNPGYQDRRAAWELYTELRTRIATQPLAYRSGDEATALDSIYRLFKLSRRMIRRHHGCTHFAALVVLVLNDSIRPFTAKWHRKKMDGRLSSADERFIFRQELSDLQTALRKFTSLLAALAQDVSAPPALNPAAPPALPPEIAARVSFGIREGTLSPEDMANINASERTEVLLRRAAAGTPNRQDDQDAVGLALSGGGIRSATFALGVIQTLARKGILQQVDFLSTVSGGGYLGCFISSFLNSPRAEVKLKPEAGAQPFGAGRDQESRAVRHLRNHGKYLTEGGIKTGAAIVAMVAYGILVSLLLVSPILLGAVLVVKEFFAGPFSHPRAAFWPPGMYTLYALALLGVAVLGLPLAQKVPNSRKPGEFWGRLCVVLGAVCAVLLAAEAVPFIGQWLRSFGGARVALGIVAASPLVLGALGLWLGPESIGGRAAFTIFGLTGPLLFLLAFFWLTEIFIVNSPDDGSYWLWIAFLFTLFYTGFFLNINFASPHLYYRNRLARTYLTRLDEQVADLRVEDPQPLSGMNSRNKGPYHLINAALNIPTSDDPNLRGRNADFFLFSKHFCGSPITGFFSTTRWEEVDSHLDLGTAMAISGAAAAPHMGTLTSWHYTFILAMLNVRLGYWIRRPDKYPLPFANWINFTRELTGQMSHRSRYLNVSDGGHIENLGIYELLRRRCKFIVAVDGEADPRRSFGGLLNMTQFAAIDLGVRIEPDLGDLRPDRDANGRAHFIMSRIKYPKPPNEPNEDRGLLLYVKASLTGNEPEFLKKYDAENPSFPHQSTANQLFSETQFEAYRALGEHIAQDLFRKDLVGDWDAAWSVREWFELLAINLLEPAAGRD
jgi:hypothetical protein